jgi:hypothetical protein
LGEGIEGGLSSAMGRHVFPLLGREYFLSTSQDKSMMKIQFNKQQTIRGAFKAK